MSEEEKRELQELIGLLYGNNISQYGKRRLEEYINKQQKVIDLMVYELAIPGKSIELINLYKQVYPDKPIYDVIKEYFYKKAEEENE